MKQILTILILLTTTSVIAQQHFSRGNPTSIDSNKGTAVARYTMLQRDTAKSTVWSSNGGAANVGGVLYLFNGIKWVALSGGGDVTTSQLNDSMQVARDSFAAIRADFPSGGGDVTTSQLNDSMAVVRDSLADHWAAIMARELLSNKVTSFASPDNTTYPTTAAVNNLLGSFKLKSDSVANDGYTRRDRTQHIADSVASLIPSTSGFVPYTGATGNVDLGAHRITATRVNTDTIEAVTSAGVHIHNTAHEDIMIIGAGGGKTASLYGGINLDGNKIQNSTDTVLTTNSSGTIGKAALVSVYLKIATAAGTYVAATTTSVNTVPITSGINNTVTASALTLTTTTLNPTVVTSSLTSVGTITAGTWSSTIGSAATGSTQAINNNSTQIATTAYVDRYFPVDTTISAAYTLTIRDFHRTIHCTNGSNIALTIPTGLGTTFTCVVLAEGAGTVTPTTSSTTFYYQPTSTTKIKSQGGATIRSWATANSYLIIGSLE